jgi:hypothetical protein
VEWQCLIILNLEISLCNFDQLRRDAIATQLVILQDLVLNNNNNEQRW